MINTAYSPDIYVTNPVSMTVAAEKEDTVNTATNKITALYCRLSKEDLRYAKTEAERESLSIKNQKELLLRYAKEHRFPNPVFYIDDGYTGTNFDRPGFRDMMTDMQNDKVAVCITKDLSRLGRESTKVGELQKFTFPALEVRYIAVEDRYDSANISGFDYDIALMRNMFNEFLPLDTSRKIRAINRMKGENGRTLTFNIPYGYKKDPDDSNHWIIDEEAAAVVKHIFSLCMEGRGPNQIANQLTQERILNPTSYKLEKGMPVNTAINEIPYQWNSGTVIRILERREYTGCTVAFKTFTNSLWDKKQRRNPVENQVITQGTHEAIIDEDTFEKVQQIRESRHRRTKTGKSSVFSGLMYCHDCGDKMYYCTANGFEAKQDFFECTAHHKDKNECKTHFIRCGILEELVWEHIKLVISYVYFHESYFREYMKRVTENVSKEEIKSLKKQLLQAEKRIAEIDNLFIKTYEDNAKDKLSDERFRMLSERYDAEQSELREKAIQLKTRIDSQEENTENLEKFISLIKSHIEDDGLNGYNLHELIQAIYIENADVENGVNEAIESGTDDTDNEGECVVYTKKPKSSTAKKQRIRKIHIKYDFVGFIPIKSLMQYAEEADKHPESEISA